jgi:hypothetical protein
MSRSLPRTNRDPVYEAVLVTTARPLWALSRALRRRGKVLYWARAETAPVSG